VPDSVMLFRYVALGFVSHRIHYDHPYVKKTEGYPDLVVPGGIHTISMFELGRARTLRPRRATGKLRGERCGRCS